MAWFQKKEPGSGPRPPAAIRVHELLDERSIVFPAAALDKPAVLEALVSRTCEAHDLGDPAPFLQRVREREQGISTTLDSGLSLPHARIDGLDAIAAGLALLPHGLKDPHNPDIPIRAMFLFFSPNRQDAFSKHLQVLRGVSALFQAPLIAELCALKSPAEALSRLAAAEA